MFEDSGTAGAERGGVTMADDEPSIIDHLERIARELLRRNQSRDAQYVQRAADIMGGLVVDCTETDAEHEKMLAAIANDDDPETTCVDCGAPLVPDPPDLKH